MIGSPLTIAPEIYESLEDNSYYTSKSDLWSIGCVFYKILFGFYPF